jgi:hypothetical protein
MKKISTIFFLLILLLSALAISAKDKKYAPKSPEIQKMGSPEYNYPYQAIYSKSKNLYYILDCPQSYISDPPMATFAKEAKDKKDIKIQTAVTKNGSLWSVHGTYSEFPSSVGPFYFGSPMTLDIIEDTLYIVDDISMLYKINLNTSSTFSKIRIVDVDTTTRSYLYNYPIPVIFNSCMDSSKYIYYLCELYDSTKFTNWGNVRQTRKILRYDYRTDDSYFLDLPEQTTLKMQGLCFDKLNNRLICVTADDTSKVIGIKLDSLLTTNILYSEKSTYEKGFFCNIFIDSTNSFLISNTGMVKNIRLGGMDTINTYGQYFIIRDFDSTFTKSRLILKVDDGTFSKHFYYSAENNIIVLMEKDRIQFASLNTNPPELLYPPNNSTGISKPTWFNWGKNSHDNIFILKVAKDSNFVNLVIDSMFYANNIDGQFVWDSLESNQKYYWKVMTKGDGYFYKNSTYWSSIFNFTTGDTTYPAPNLIAPTDSSEIHWSVTFQWDSVPGANGYILKYYAPENPYPFENRIYTTSTTFTDNELPDYSYYPIHWKVKAADGPNASEWSPERVLLFYRYRLYSPDYFRENSANSSHLVGSSVELIWDSVRRANGYTIKYRKLWEDDFIKEYNTDSCTIFIDSLSYDTAYLFYIRSFNDTTVSNWGSLIVMTYTSELDPPLLIVPGNGENGINQNSEFIWKNNNSKNYSVDIIEYGNDQPVDSLFDFKNGNSIPACFFNPAESIRNLSDTICRPKRVLKDRTVYLWRVQSLSDSGISKWSKARYFVTDLSASTNDKNDITISPNPCENTALVQIKANIPQGSKYTMSIMNYLGQLVEERDLGALSNDNKVIPITTTHLPPGSYYIVLSDGKSRLKPSIFTVIR